MNIMKKVWVMGLIAALIFVVGCGKVKETQEIELPYYHKSVNFIEMPKEFNAYMYATTSNSIFFFTENESGTDEDYHVTNEFYIQPFDGTDATKLDFKLEDAYVRAVFAKEKGGENSYFVYWLDLDAAHISEFDESGTCVTSVVLNDAFHSIEYFPQFVAFDNGDYLIATESDLYHVDNSGAIVGTIDIDSKKTEVVNVDKLLQNDSETTYVVYDKSTSNSNSIFVSEIDLSGNKLKTTRDLPYNNYMISLFDGQHFATTDDKYIYAFDMNAKNDEKIVDLEKQSILFSQIEAIIKVGDEIKILSMDKKSLGGEVYLFTLSEEQNSDLPQSAKTTEDGRTIINVAVPEYYPYQIEYYTKKYNQLSGDSFVEIDRFEGTADDYLGYGSRPDVLILDDYVDVEPMARKGILANLLPMFDGQNEYDVNNILPKIRELLSVEGGLYSVSDRFELLIRSSDMSELDANGKCNTIDYLNWLDMYYVNKEIRGNHGVDLLISGDIANFYDESVGTCEFDSENFRNLLLAVKHFTDSHKGEPQSYTELMNENGLSYLETDIVVDPRYADTWTRRELDYDEFCIMGIPTMSGDDVVYMNISYPMVILETSSIKPAAFDFVMYYAYNGKREGVGYTIYEVDVTTTDARLSIFKDIIDAEIYNTEKPYNNSVSSTSERGFIEHYYTEDDKELLTQMIERAVPETKTHKDVVEIVISELDSYLYEGKSVDEVCEVIQSRVSIYLQERK